MLLCLLDSVNMKLKDFLQGKLVMIFSNQRANQGRCRAGRFTLMMSASIKPYSIGVRYTIRNLSPSFF